MRSVITLQLGGYANHVGAHFWNMQDEAAGLAEAGGAEGDAFAELDAGVLYRESASAQAAARWTPRLVLFDLSGALGGVSASAAHEGGGAAPPAVATWHGGARVVRRDAVPKSGFVRALEAEAAAAAAEPDADAREASDDDVDDDSRAATRRRARAPPPPLPELAPPGAGADDGGEAHDDVEAAGAALEGAVSYWTDFSKALLHPRSALLLPGAWHGVTPFDGYGDSAEHGAGPTAEDAHDRIRYFAEECDAVAGFQLIAHDAGGFGALTEKMLTHVRDEYPRAPVLLWSARPPVPPGEPGSARSARLAAALAAAHVAPLADVYAPLGLSGGLAAALRPGGVTLDDSQAFHTSAVLAAHIDAATLSWRLRRHGGGPRGRSALGACELSDAVALLSGGGAPRPFAACALALPGPAVPRVTPGVGTGAQPPLSLASLVSLTDGLPATLEAPLFEAHALRGLRWDDQGAAADPSAAHAAAQAALRAADVRCMRAICVAAAPLAVPLSFPRILHARSQRAPALPPPPNPETAPAAARLAAAEDFAPLLRATAAELRRVARTAAGVAALSSWGFAPTDTDEAAERIDTLGAAYDDGADASD